ncbi:MAG: class I SAM-dependent methyltransferase [Bacteroidota bacterium]|nr:class I SAM-dependent methyltransferase [Bacteroidota bacterium]
MLNKLFKSQKLRSGKFEDPAKNLNCSEFEVNNWIVSDFVVNKLVPVVGFHPFPLTELMLMTATVCRFKPELIFEWGTNIGKSARIFYEISKTFDIKTEVHSIDLPDDVFHNEHPKNDRGRMVKGIKEVQLHQADGLECSLGLIKQKAPKGKVLFFVDGDHSYESVKKELETILEHVPDAVVLLHDTFYQSEEAKYNVGPHKAVKEVMAKHGEKYTVLSINMGLPGMSLVYKK